MTIKCSEENKRHYKAGGGTTVAQNFLITFDRTSSEFDSLQTTLPFQ